MFENVLTGQKYINSLSFMISCKLILAFVQTTHSNENSQKVLAEMLSAKAKLLIRSDLVKDLLWSSVWTLSCSYSFS